MDAVYHIILKKEKQWINILLNSKDILFWITSENKTSPKGNFVPATHQFLVDK